METFSWDARYETGLPSIDAQHRDLFSIINRMGELRVLDGSADAAALQEVFDKLGDYARLHFAEEEGLMAECGVDPAYAEAHKTLHRNFLEQLTFLWRMGGEGSDPAERVHDFLSSWLAFHVLSEDQKLAHQVKLLKAGAAPAAALAAANEIVGRSAGALLVALRNLYHVLTAQNHDLAQANRHLEAQVVERTQELEEVNAYLQSEHQEARTLLMKFEEAQSQLLQSEKMASIGQLAAGVAHEINNPIGFVNSNLGMLKQYANRLMDLVVAYEAVEPQLPAETRASLATARQAADIDFLRQDLADLLKESEDGLARVKKIVNDLKDFSRVGEIEWQEADLVAGLESTLNVVWNEIKYKAEVIRELTPLPPVRCVPAQLNQVFMNLLVNAAQAIEERGTITLRSAVDGDHVWIEIADTGKGMPPEVRRRIFEPFFTTKPVGKGTGLGLSLSYDIVTKHGGSFDVESEPGKGTIFRLWLPLAGPEDIAAKEGQPA